jgi:serine/threonine protein kinase
MPCCAPHHQLNAASVGISVSLENLSLEEFQLYVLCVLLALKALHEKGLVHRDIRAPNIVRCAHLDPATQGWRYYYKLIDLETVAQENKVRGIVGNFAGVLAVLH